MFDKGPLPELLYCVPSIFSVPQNESLSLQYIRISFSVPCSLTSFHFFPERLCFLSLFPIFLSLSCPPSNVTCHFPRVPVPLSYKLKDLLQLFVPFTTPRLSLCLSVHHCVSHRPLQLLIWLHPPVFILVFLWLVCFVPAILFLSTSCCLTIPSFIFLLQSQAFSSQRCHLPWHEGLNNELILTEATAVVSEGDPFDPELRLFHLFQLLLEKFRKFVSSARWGVKAGRGPKMIKDGYRANSGLSII